MFGEIAAVLRLLPRVIAVVKLVEEILDPSVSGDEKKEAALDILQSAGLSDRLVELAGDLIDLVVSVMHFFGFFKRQKGEEPEEPPVPEAKLSPMAADAKRVQEEVNASEEEFKRFLKGTKRAN